MRLSPFHKHLAKLIAQGLPNRDIMKQVSISGSRLSVLKKNPLMIREIDRQSRLEESKYEKALEVFGQEAESVARKLVKMVKSDVAVSDKVRAELGLRILDKLAEKEGVGGTSQAKGGVGVGTEESFESMLRVTRRSGGGGTEVDEETLQQAFIDLEEENDRLEAAALTMNDSQVIEMESVGSVGSVTGLTWATPPVLADDDDGSSPTAEPVSTGGVSGEGEPEPELDDMTFHAISDDLLAMLG